jgi:aspartyl-tRNA(Asn)/glutamyl-tRNA(Gln) amidotransferase subunit A
MPRISGSTLHLLRRLAARPLGRKALWRAISPDFHFREVMALPPEARLLLEDVPAPVRGRAVHGWPDQRCSPPPGGRSSCAALRAGYASGRASPSTVLTSILDRLAARDFGPATHSPFVTVDEQQARVAARAADERWRQGRALGPLDGIPLPVKDHLDFAGVPTRGGCAYLDRPAERDAFVVARLREAGAVLAAKAHATECGLNPLGYSQQFDLPRNAYASDRGAGGSSTGSAVAVALGLAPVAVASDGGGSIRIPACLNGVLGLKPTFARISRTGDLWGASTVHHVGAIASSTADLVDLLEVASGRDPADPGTWLAADYPTAPVEWRQALGRGVGGCRIGVLRSAIAEAATPIAQACEAALSALKREGAELVDTTLPLFSHASAIGAGIIASEVAANVSDQAAQYEAHVGDELALLVGLMESLRAQELLQLGRTRAALRRQAAAVFTDVDLLALPVTASGAPRYALEGGRTGILDSEAIAAMTRFTFFANLTGLPACSIPVGLHEGLPIGLQLVGDAWDEASVIAAMAHAERMGLTQIPASPGWRPLLEGV